MPSKTFAEFPQPSCACGAGCESAHFTRASIYIVADGKGGELVCAFDGYLCENCGRVWTRPDPDYYGKPAEINPERIEEYDDCGRDPWTLH